MDLSGTGMRLRFDGAKPNTKVGEVDSFGIRGGGKQIAVSGRIVWIKRAGLRRNFEIGVHFVNLTPTVQAAVRHIAQYGMTGGSFKMPAGAAPRPEPEEPQAETTEPPPQSNHIEVEDLYAVLGVERGASSSQVRAAYHRLARETHPDVCDNADAHDRFTLISKAYKVLRDEELRERYDKMLKSRAG